MSKPKKPRAKRILSFDQSSIRTGWSCFDGTDLVNFGLIDLSDVPVEDRLNAMALRISELAERYNPETIVMEGVVYQRNVSTLITLANLQGMIFEICRQRGAGKCVLPPTAWRRQLEIKQGAGIKREELKKQAVALIYASYGIYVDEDVCEAICIGLGWLKMNGLLPDLKQIVRKRDYKEK